MMALLKQCCEKKIFALTTSAFMYTHEYFYYYFFCAAWNFIKSFCSRAMFTNNGKFASGWGALDVYESEKGSRVWYVRSYMDIKLCLHIGHTHEMKLKLPCMLSSYICVPCNCDLMKNYSCKLDGDARFVNFGIHMQDF